MIEIHHINNSTRFKRWLTDCYDLTVQDKEAKLLPESSNWRTEILFEDCDIGHIKFPHHYALVIMLKMNNFVMHTMMIDTSIETSGKIVQNVLVAQCCQQNRWSMRNSLPFRAGKSAWAGISAVQLHSLTKYTIGHRRQGSFYCNAVSALNVAPYFEKVDFHKLQNGSDIRGVAVAGVEGEPVSLTEPVTEAIAAAFALWLLEKKKVDTPRSLKISIGHDSRISAQKLQVLLSRIRDAVSRGIAGTGLKVIQYGLASTPAMFNSTITEDEGFHCPVDGSIMITEKPLDGFHIVVDAGNGAGGFFAYYMELQCITAITYEAFPMATQGKVLEPLGAITAGSQFLEPDGFFPNHIPNPEDKTAMRAITQAVLDNKADLGIIFDTDVDRSAAVDSSGRELNRNKLIALMSAIVLEEHPGTTIVTDSVTSDGLTAFIEKKLGGKHHRFKRGYKNVIDEAVRLVKLLNKLASARATGAGSGSKVLTDLVEGLEEPSVAVELRLKIDQNHTDIQGGSFRTYGEAVLKHLENTIDSDPELHKAPINYEGLRVSGYGGWFLLRLSLHDPVLPLNIEAQSNEDAVKLGLAVVAAVKEFSALDTSFLDKFVG
ncbi:hypothetical protein GIB67_031025 [Kingdonia uniflora]|uniref:Phosphoglucomutase n=1 Tax=Kingdonia uniflora TaxID=39325 RepID=A0A7J7NG72_9MAGN|nr:hypothetical protein GIB67_031025 [Kingdonia uniflora]